MAGSQSQKPRPTKAKSSSRSSGSKAARSSSGGPKGDVKEIIRSYLYSMRQAGMMEVDESDVLQASGFKRTDSTGYRVAMKALTKELGHVEKSKGKMSLTQDGLEFVAENGVQVKVSAPATMEGNQAQLRTTISENAKAPAKALDGMWNVLLDGQGHDQEELLAAAGYQRSDSTGYREVMKWFKKLELIEKQGKMFQFTDKVYRYGSRPENN